MDHLVARRIGKNQPDIELITDATIVPLPSELAHGYGYRRDDRGAAAIRTEGEQVVEERERPWDRREKSAHGDRTV